MKTISSWLSRPPEYQSFLKTHKAQFLQAALQIAGVGVLLIAFLNLRQGAVNLAAYLLLVSLACAYGLYLNGRKRYVPAATLLLVLLFSAQIFNLVDGAALHDPGIAAFPLLILFAAFLLDFRGLLVSLIVSLVSIWGIYLSSQLEIYAFSSNPGLFRTLILSILFIAFSLTAWAVLNTFTSFGGYVTQAYESTMKGWAKALELRDVETVGHSKRVTTLAVALGEKLGLPADEIENLRYGALLHDVGKIGIPDSILFKQGELSEEEFSRVKQHPKYAYELLQNVPYLNKAVDVPLYHHERWDGKGYPDGLSGEEIPTIARIFSVIDQWDALRSIRPYRKAWSDDDATAYIRQGAGTIYDPKVVEAFLELVDSWIPPTRPSDATSAQLPA